MKSHVVLLFLIMLTIPTFGLLSKSLPTGVATFNGPIYTNAVLGYANITRLLAYNSSLNSYGASLQLNVILQANTTNGETYYFWLQNVADFITNESEMGFTDNIWNFTTPLAGVTNVTGNGEICYTLNPFRHFSFYGYSTPMFNYSFPLAFYLLISESYVPSGIYVNFTYVIIQNNTILPPHVVTYDRVFIPVPQLQSAYIIVNNATTPNETVGICEYLGNYIDAELVWGGYSNGESTEFLSMSSYLALMYNSGNNWIPFKAVYDFGEDTAESAQNLHVAISSNGDAYVSVGYPDYGLLTNNFNPAIPGFLFLNITSKIPFIINSTKTTRFVGYVNYPTKIYFFKNYTINSSSFAILNQPSMIIVKPSSYFKNVTITPNYTYYYLVSINTPIPINLSINGVRMVVNSSSMFLTEGDVIKVLNNTYYASPYVRYVITNITPSSQLVVNQPENIDVKVIKQYLVSINTPIPINLSINGVRMVVNSSSMFLTEGDVIKVLNNTYYASPYVRYVITNITPSSQLVVNQPENIDVKVIKQYLVSINGISNWYNEGTTITLPSNIPFYMVGEYIGTYNTSPGSTILINRPIVETLVEHLNYLIVGLFVVIAVAMGIAITIIVKD
ncbi:MAG: thermopsin family protease [Sulfolobus sp.]|nr:thermopsin family protease [Sulfolobus sp.]